MNWLEFAPAASAVFSLCAATVAALNVRWTGKNADRQFALSYINDVNRWAADVLEAYRATHHLFGGPHGKNGRSFEDKGIDCNTILGELFHYQDMGRFLFPSADAEPQKLLERMIAETFAFQRTLFSNEILSSEDSATHKSLRDEFVEAVRQEVQTHRRYSDAKRYLN